MSVSADASTSATTTAVSESDWRRLHSRVLPNPVPLNEFKQCVTNGTLQDRYRANDLHKIAQEMRDILREHGELREAACFPVKGKKGELGMAMAAAIRVLAHDHNVSANADRTTTDTATAGPSAPLSRPRRGADDASANHDDLAPSTSPEEHDEGATSSTRTTTQHHRTSGRHLPITDHIDALSSSPPPGATGIHHHHKNNQNSTLPERTHPLTDANLERAGKVDRPKDAAQAGGTTSPEKTVHPSLSLRIARNASQPHSPELRSATSPATRMSGPDVNTRDEPSTVSHAPAHDTEQSSAPAPSPTVAETKSTGTVNELNAFNEYGSPFFQILNVVRRFQLRYGTHQLRFDIPVQYAQAVAARRLRLCIIPFRHPNLPARWPTAKEIVVYVNDQCVTIPWKRAWPERKEEVAKSFLPLDVTQMLLSRSGASTTQRLQVDVFASDYFAPALLVVGQPFSLEEVVEQTLYDITGSSDVQSIEGHLLSLLRGYEASGTSSFSVPRPASLAGGASPPAQAKLAASMNDALRFYHNIMEEDVDDGIEVDDPIITTKCPISQLPLHIPMRGAYCRHLQCVDLTSYLMSCSKGCYWNCALCDAPLRPRDVRVDTTLWSFLRQFHTQSATLPHYLRLSTRGGGGGGGSDNGEGSASATLGGIAAAAPRQYYWHVTRPHGADADILLDSSDEEAGESERAPAPPPRDTVEPPQVGQKRQRSPLEPPPLTMDRLEGTMDNPIEL